MFQPHEALIIRPPSESRSVLIRVVRGCKWNRCKFCGQYLYFGVPEYSERSLEEVKQDIKNSKIFYSNLYSKLYSGLEKKIETCFFGDADPLNIDTEKFCKITKYLREVYSEVKRLTCYTRASTLYKKRNDLEKIAKAGLDRVHVGLETGHDLLLAFHKKGQNRKILIESGKAVKNAGIELSYYVLLGLAGQKWQDKQGKWHSWHEHANETSSIINNVNPDFVRFRRLWIYDGCPLYEEIKKGNFIEQSAEGSVLELRKILSQLCDITSQILCDHANNYVQVYGKMPCDKKRMLKKIDEFLSMPEEKKQEHYQLVGSRI